MAKTRERKLEIAQRIHDLVCERARPRPAAADLRRAHLHADHRRRGVAPVRGRDDRGHPPDQGGAARRAHVARRLQRLLRRRPARAQRPQLRLPAPLRRGRAGPRDGQPEPHHALRGDRRARSASSPTTSSSTAARTRWSASSPTSRRSRRRRRGRGRRPDRAAWSPRRRCTGTSCAARRTAWRPRSTRSVEKIGAVPTLNDVLLPAMKEVGDKFGAGELILPVRAPERRGHEARRRAARELPRQARGLHEGHRRARDRVRRRARHRQVARQHDPHQQRLHGRRPRQAGPDRRRSSTPRRSTTRPRSASARCSSRPPSRCRCACRSCTRTASSSRCWSAARRSTASSACARTTPTARSPTRSTSPASSTARTPSRASP